MTRNLTCKLPTFYTNGNIKNIIYYDNGKVKSIINYDNNNVISYLEYDDNYNITNSNINSNTISNTNVNLDLPIFYEDGNLKSLVSINNDKTVYSYRDNTNNFLFKFEYDDKYNIIGSKIYNDENDLIYEMFKIDNNVYENIKILKPFIIKASFVNGKLDGEYIISNLYKQYSTIPGMKLFNNLDFFIFDNNDSVYNNLITIINSNHIDFTINEYFQMFFSCDILNGKFIEYVDDEPTIICNYIDNKLNGKYVKYYDNFLPFKICNYNNGKLHGKYEEFYDNGNHGLICNYDNGELHGKYEEYYNNKKPYAIIDYYKGKINGKYEQFYVVKSLNNIKNIYNKVFNNSFFVKENLSLFLNNITSNKIVTIYTIKYYVNGVYNKSKRYICDLNDSNWMQNKILFSETVKNPIENHNEFHLYNSYNKNINNEKLLFNFINKYIDFSFSSFISGIFYYIHLENYTIIMFLDNNFLNIKITSNEQLVCHKQYINSNNVKYVFHKQIFPLQKYFLNLF